MQPKVQRPAFCGFECDFDDADWIIFGAPFDGTTSFRPGTRFGPERMRIESWGLESYSPYQNLDLEDLAVHDAGDLELPNGNAAVAVDLVEKYTKRLLNKKKYPVMIGGEHLLTLGAVKAVYDKYPDLHLVHLDAHTDLRDEYLGEKLSHANVIYRIAEFMDPARIHSFGVRSGTKREFVFGHQKLDFNPFSIVGLRDKLLPVIESGDPVYLTLDLDVLDPSCFPGTGTPEPGGPTFQELLQEILTLFNLHVVAFDLMELSPPWDPTGVSTAAAAKLLREMLLLFAG